MMTPDTHVYSLSDVCKSIQKTLASRYGSPFWVKAELHKLNFYPGSGHCFPELLQKENNTTVAQMRATLWSADYQRINACFLQTIHEPLKDGIEILFFASVQYDPRYGLSLHIHDIDPSYVLGSLERERLLCLKRLTEEGLLERNKQLALPLLPAKIAVISAQTSKGFSDFMQVLHNNDRGYGFYVHLFPALLQGDGAVASICAALQEVQDFPLDFDVVMIIRGGGDEVGLSAYNHYDLAREICLYPIPVLTGIGHSTNLTVSEQVAWFHGITPTELAVFVLECFEDFENNLAYAAERLKVLSDKHLKTAWEALHRMESLLKIPDLKLRYRKEQLQRMQEQLKRLALKTLKNQAQETLQIEKTLHRFSPERTLKMGYSLTYQNNKLLFKACDIKPGEELTTVLADGMVISRALATKDKE